MNQRLGYDRDIIGRSGGLTGAWITLCVGLCLGSAAWAQPAGGEAAEPSAMPSESSELLPDESSEPSAMPSEPSGEAAGVVPTVLHTPISSAVAGRAVVIKAGVNGDWQVSQMTVHYRPTGGAWQVAPIERSRDGAWMGRIPAAAVDSVGLEYYIESVAADRTVRRHFASPVTPHPVRVFGDSPTDVQRDQLARYDGARSRARIDGWLVAYGSKLEDPGQTDRFSDRLWQAEAQYIYRPLTLLHDMRFGFGMMRGNWPTVDETPLREGDTPGLNYGYGELNLEVHRWLSVGARLILGASEVGFTAGVGAVARIGDISGTHFEVRYSTIGDVGDATELRFRWATVPRFPMALGIEFTDWPAGDADAANLVYDVGFEIDPMWTVNARIGSTGRANSLDGGFQAGMGLMADF